MTSNRTKTSFERYWASIHLPGPDSPLFKPYVAAYDAARRAYEAGTRDRSLGDEQIIDEQVEAIKSLMAENDGLRAVIKAQREVLASGRA
jgi:hypothetical protein